MKIYQTYLGIREENGELYLYDGFDNFQFITVCPDKMRDYLNNLLENVNTIYDRIWQKGKGRCYCGSYATDRINIEFDHLNLF